MFKKISAFLIAAALIGGVTSCYMPDSIFPDSAFDTEEDEITGDELSLYDFAFDLSGVEYELPMSYKVLSARGWKLMGEGTGEEQDADASDLPAGTANANAAATTAEDTENKVYQSDTVMEPGEYSDYVPADRAGQSIGLKFYNDSKRSQALENCLLVGVMVETGSDDQVDFTLNGDITLGKTYEEVVTTYGKPSYTKDYVKADGELAAINDIAFVDNYDEESDAFTHTLFYSVGDTSVVSFELGDCEGVSDSVVRITMDNMDEVEDEYDYSKDLKSRSSVIKLYKGPNLLGKTFNDFAFKYESNLYTLPIPIQKLVDDGWTFVRGAADRVPIGTTKDGVVMRKGNLAMDILVHNYDLKRPQTPINCYAVSLSASVVGPNVKILMPKGVTLGSEYSELVTAFGNEYAALSGYVDETAEAENGETQETDSNTADNNAATQETAAAPAVGTVETYELTEEEGCSIVKTVEEEYTVYSYIMPDDVPTITLPVSITDIKDPNSDLLGENRKQIDVYLSNANGKVLKIYLQNCPEYVVNETEILEQQMEAAEKAAQEAAKKAAQEATDAQAAETSAGTGASESVKDTESTTAAAAAEGAKTTQATKSAGKTVKAQQSSAGSKDTKSVVQQRLEVLRLLRHKR